MCDSLCSQSRTVDIYIPLVMDTTPKFVTALYNYNAILLHLIVIIYNVLFIIFIDRYKPSTLRKART